jgi:hypothetical protein
MEVGTALEVGDALAEVDARTADDAMDIVALVQQELREEGAVLTRYTCDEGDMLVYACVHLLLFMGFVSARKDSAFSPKNSHARPKKRQKSVCLQRL